ncbi:DsbA family protein [Chryseobacterium sp. M5A1_1a]
MDAKYKYTDKSTKQSPCQGGFCRIQESIAETKFIVQQIEKPVKAIYFTGPICSSCWGIEPQLRKLQLEFGKSIETICFYLINWNLIKCNIILAKKLLQNGVLSSLKKELNYVFELFILKLWKRNFCFY